LFKRRSPVSEERNIKRVENNEQAEERSLASDFLAGAAIAAGGKVGLDAAAQVSQTVGKLVDKVRPSSKEEPKKE
jgi:hypothetical protein